MQLQTRLLIWVGLESMERATQAAPQSVMEAAGHWLPPYPS